MLPDGIRDGKHRATGKFGTRWHNPSPFIIEIPG